MASHFLFHSAVGETVPWNAKFAFPTQASRVIQSRTRIPPITTPQMGSLAAPLNSSAKGRLIQIKLPADGYLNPLESYLRFDLVLCAAAGSGSVNVNAPRILNSVHGMFRRLRVLYGSTVFEDIQLYNSLVRTITNVAVGERYQNNVGCILEGFGSDAMRAALFNPLTRGVVADSGHSGFTGNLANQTYAAATGSGSATALPLLQVNGPVLITTSNELVANGGVKHTFCIQLASGIFTQQKLLPLKWMANQLMIELELEEPAGFIVTGQTAQVIASTAASSAAGNPTLPALSNEIIPALYTTVPTMSATAGVTLHADDSSPAINYYLDNIYYVADLLEFDSTYDAAFYQGMATTGVPIKFASWHTHQHVPAGANTTLIIQERSRSVKAAFSILRKRGDLSYTLLTDPYWTYPGITPALNANYAEATHGIDEFQFRIGGKYFPSQPVKCTNGGTEPLAELQKALNVMGDYQLDAPIKPENWWRYRGNCVLGVEFESSNGFEMSGINAEELADLQLIVKLANSSATFDSDMYFTTFVHYDALLIIRPQNVIELVQ